MVERVWVGTILGMLVIMIFAGAVSMAVYSGVFIGRALWDCRHYDCLAPSGNCVRKN